MRVFVFVLDWNPGFDSARVRYATLRFRGMTNFNKWTCSSYRLCMNQAYVQKRVSYIELLPSSAAALPAVSIELASIKSTQRRSATINAVIKCNQHLSILYMAGGCTMLNSERSDWVRWGSIGSGGVISHTGLEVRKSVPDCKSSWD